MRHVVTGWDHLFGPWISDRVGGGYVPGRGSTIGLFDAEAGILAATYFTDCNGASIVMHCAGEGKSWLNREFLWFTFYYPFEQLNVRKILSPVESDNLDCIRFIEHIGFTLEATLKDASPKGDLLIYSMGKQQCKWLSLKEKHRGKAESSSNT